MLVKVVSLHFLPAAAPSAIDLISDSLADTRAFAGCLGAELLVDAADPTRIHLLERWESTTAADAYSAFRAGDGAMPGLPEMLAGAPSVIVATPRGSDDGGR